MSEQTAISSRPPLVSIILILITTTLGFVVIGPLIGFFLALPFYDGSLMDLPQKLASPADYPEIKNAILILQGSATFFGLIIIPSLYLYGIEKKSVFDFTRGKKIYPLMAAITAVMVIMFMGINSVFIEWNYHFKFPEFLQAFETWAREREALAEELTKFFTQFSSTGEFVFGLIVIALFPAIGEELVFRGLIQNELFRASKNHHVAIWTSAILFSAFHMQFFGFVPRLLLGALFGYLYLWSGSLVIAMIAHFVNNGFSLLMMYLNQLGVIEMDVDTPEAAPWPIVVSFTLVFGALIFYFKRFYEQKNSTTL